MPSGRLRISWLLFSLAPNHVLRPKRTAPDTPPLPSSFLPTLRPRRRRPLSVQDHELDGGPRSACHGEAPRWRVSILLFFLCSLFSRRKRQRGETVEAVHQIHGIVPCTAARPPPFMPSYSFPPSSCSRRCLSSLPFFSSSSSFIIVTHRCCCSLSSPI